MTSLATVQDLAQRTGVQFDPTDVQAIRALQDASSLVRAYTGQAFDLLTDQDITVNGSGTRALILPDYPVQEVSDVLILADDETITALDTTEWRLIGSEGILIRKASDAGWPPVWPSGFLNIALTYTAGYSTPPDAIKAATCQIASRLKVAASSVGSSGLVKSETIGSYSVSYGDTGGGTVETAGVAAGLTADERALLDRYRTLVLA